jgi:hypothetical protein
MGPLLAHVTGSESGVLALLLLLGFLLGSLTRRVRSSGERPRDDRAD